MTGPIRCDRSRRDSRLCGTCSRTENRNIKTRPSQPATRFIVNVCNRHERHVKEILAPSISLDRATLSPLLPGVQQEELLLGPTSQRRGAKRGIPRRWGQQGRRGLDLVSLCFSAPKLYGVAVLGLTAGPPRSKMRPKRDQAPLLSPEPFRALGTAGCQIRPRSQSGSWPPERISPHCDTLNLHLDAIR